MVLPMQHTPSKETRRKRNKDSYTLRMSKASFAHHRSIVKRFRCTGTLAVESALAFADTHPDFKPISA